MFDRAAFDHVRQPELLTRQANLGEGAIEECPCWSNEGTPRLLFNHSRPLADEHDLGLDVAFAEDHPQASLDIGTRRTGQGLGAKLLHLSLLIHITNHHRLVEE